MSNPKIDRFFTTLQAAIDQKSLVKLVISNPRQRTTGLKSMIINLVELKTGARLKVVYRYQTNDITKNLPVGEGIQQVETALQNDFFNADLFTGTETLQLSITQNGKVKLSSHPVNLPATPSRAHDRVKERVIETAGNIYLRELGVLNVNFEVRREMSDKYQQINRYIELLEPFFREINLPGEFHVADMGSGKGYLTFALYDYLTRKAGRAPVITGVESREELVTSSNEIALKSGFSNLNFITGTIRDVSLEKIDVLIALHACDTATDDAIFRGITSGASLIVCAPCCHKQLRKEFRVTSTLKEILKHGILEERQAEILTDGLRALMMEAHGYKTSVFEFVSTEHTPKNLMIVGRKVTRRSAGLKKTSDRIAEIKTMFGIEKHYLEELLERSDFS